MQKQCQGPGCGEMFETNRPAAKYHSDRCRQRAHRAPNRGDVSSNVRRLPSSDSGGLLVSATEAEPSAAGVLGSALGQAAMLAARRLGDLGAAETGAGVRALIEAHRAALAEAMKDAKQEADPLDEIRRSAALKLIARSG